MRRVRVSLNRISDSMKEMERELMMIRIAKLLIGKNNKLTSQSLEDFVTRYVQSMETER